MSRSTPIQYRLYGAGTGDGVLEVQLRYCERMFSVSPVAGHPPRILHESPPIPFHNELFNLSFLQLQDPLFYIRQFLSSLNVRSASGEIIARQIAYYIHHISNGNRERNFHIIAEIDFIREIWMEEDSIAGGSSEGGAVVEETVVYDEAPPPRRGVAVERVRELKSEEELGDCSICLDGLSCEKREVKGETNEESKSTLGALMVKDRKNCHHAMRNS
ncbi:unnamed protein product [Citrullus colocynthis]|uniref:Uncharacterized protein n=1 Tax=Citrullus colocynthis TaxID=252529 RepID=A0ABP0YLI8_9ROSI